MDTPAAVRERLLAEASLNTEQVVPVVAELSDEAPSAGGAERELVVAASGPAEEIDERKVPGVTAALGGGVAQPDERKVPGVTAALGGGVEQPEERKVPGI